MSRYEERMRLISRAEHLLRDPSRISGFFAQMSRDDFDELIRNCADRLTDVCDIHPSQAWDAAIVVLAEVGIKPPK
jgi:hypothetical protein